MRSRQPRPWPTRNSRPGIRAGPVVVEQLRLALARPQQGRLAGGGPFAPGHYSGRCSAVRFAATRAITTAGSRTSRAAKRPISDRAPGRRLVSVNGAGVSVATSLTVAARVPKVDITTARPSAPADTPPHTGDPLAALSAVGLRARHRHLAAKIAGIGFTATGTVLCSHNVCGTPGWSCHTDPGKRHGPTGSTSRRS